MATTMIEKQLAQERPGTTSATAVYSPSGKRGIITWMTICNTTGTAATFVLHHDDDGAVSGSSQKLFGPISVAANTTWTPPGGRCFIPVADGGNIIFTQGTSASLCITLYGAEIT